MREQVKRRQDRGLADKRGWARCASIQTTGDQYMNNGHLSGTEKVPKWSRGDSRNTGPLRPLSIALDKPPSPCHIESANAVFIDTGRIAYTRLSISNPVLVAGPTVGTSRSS